MVKMRGGSTRKAEIQIDAKSGDRGRNGLFVVAALLILGRGGLWTSGNELHVVNGRRKPCGQFFPAKWRGDICTTLRLQSCARGIPLVERVPLVHKQRKTSAPGQRPDAAAPTSLPARRSLALDAPAAAPFLRDAATHPENLSPL